MVRSKVLSDTKLPPWAYCVARAYWQGATEAAVPPGLVMVIQGRKKSSGLPSIFALLAAKICAYLACMSS